MWGREETTGTQAHGVGVLDTKREIYVRRQALLVCFVLPMKQVTAFHSQLIRLPWKEGGVLIPRVYGGRSGAWFPATILLPPHSPAPTNVALDGDPCKTRVP